MIRTIFLDADDTVFDFGKAQHAALFAAFRELGYPLTEEEYRVYDAINLYHWKKLERGETTKERLVYERFEDLFAKLGREGDVVRTEEAYQRLLGEQAFWWEGAREGVAYLSKKYDVYIVTNGHADTQRSRVEKSGLSAYVKGLFVSEAVGFAKPQKEYYDYCLAASGAKKEEILCIGDSLTSDVRGGIGYGLRTMWFNPKGLPAPDTMKIDYIVRDWNEIVSIL